MKTEVTMMGRYNTTVFLALLVGSIVVPPVFESSTRAEGTEEGGRAISQENDDAYALEAKVEQRLRLRDDLQWANLGVQAKGGHVTLMGEVATEQDRALATNIASTIPEVRALTNRIIVDPALSLDERADGNHLGERAGRNVILDGQQGVKRKEVLP
jgi:hypothetical protein